MFTILVVLHHYYVVVPLERVFDQLLVKLPQPETCVKTSCCL